MDKKNLIEELETCIETGDVESQHAKADRLLIEFIDDKEIKNAYDKIYKWYS